MGSCGSGVRPLAGSTRFAPRLLRSHRAKGRGPGAGFRGRTRVHWRAGRGVLRTRLLGSGAKRRRRLPRSWGEKRGSGRVHLPSLSQRQDRPHRSRGDTRRHRSEDRAAASTSQVASIGRSERAGSRDRRGSPKGPRRRGGERGLQRGDRRPRPRRRRDSAARRLRQTRFPPRHRSTRENPSPRAEDRPRRQA